MVSPSVLLASDGLVWWFSLSIGVGVAHVSPVFRWPIQPSLLSGFVNDEVKHCIPKCKVCV